MVPKHKLPESIPLHGQGLNCGTNVCELEDSCWGKGMEFELADKAWAHKKTPPTSFPNCLLESTWVKSAFPYGLSPHHEEAKWDTIGIVGETSARLPHYMGPTLACPMENEMPLVHHIVERWECGYINEDNKHLNEKTQGHLMLKPKSKLMQMEWE
jgi:hypothetical protein